MWCPCCMMSLCSRIFYFFFSSLVINVVTTWSNVTDVIVWPITSNPNPRVLKIEKYEIILKEIENKNKNKVYRFISLYYCGRWAYIAMLKKQYYCRDVSSGWVDLIYDTYFRIFYILLYIIGLYNLWLWQVLHFCHLIFFVYVQNKEMKKWKIK